MSHLFESLTLRKLQLRNRIGVSPMCQYSSVDGLANDWHMVHLGSRALGGAGLVIMEATAVRADGRISDADTGLWSDTHIEPLARLTSFIKAYGAAAGIQLAHAGRKASRARPWLGDRGLEPTQGGWQIIGPSPIAFSEAYPAPAEMSCEDIQQIIQSFADAAARSYAAGFNFLELHAAHGYLLNSFLSPLSNQRGDAYGGSFNNRIRLTVEIVQAIRKVWPDSLPLAIRLSVTDWIEGGWQLEDSIALAKILNKDGVDLIDCSSGGNVAHAKIPVGANYQVPFAAAIKRSSGLATSAVGMICEAMQADAIIRNQEADLVLLGRESLRDPNWPIHAAKKLGIKGATLVPKQYLRAFPSPD